MAMPKDLAQQLWLEAASKYYGEPIGKDELDDDWTTYLAEGQLIRAYSYVVG